MAWSTRELAELAGTTVRAVRHYHEVGLLSEPRRRANGYKQYGVAHLVRTLRIKRLADLGFSLPQIAELGDADQHPREALRGLDTRLAHTLERLQRVRVEVHEILHQAAPTDLPPALAAKIRDADLSDADRSLLVVMSRVFEPSVVTAFVDTLQALPPSAAAAAFDDLPADADEPTRQDLAISLLPRSRTMRAMVPGLWSTTTRSNAAATRTIDQAVRDLYNPAQFDVLRRIGLLLRSQPDPVRPDLPPVGSAGTCRMPDSATEEIATGHRPVGRDVRVQLRHVGAADGPLTDARVATRPRRLDDGLAVQPLVSPKRIPRGAARSTINARLDPCPAPAPAARQKAAPPPSPAAPRRTEPGSGGQPVREQAVRGALQLQRAAHEVGGERHLGRR